MYSYSKNKSEITINYFKNINTFTKTGLLNPNVNGFCIRILQPSELLEGLRIVYITYIINIKSQEVTGESQ